MKPSILLLTAATLATSFSLAAKPNLTEAEITKLLSADSRPEADAARDPARLPAKIMAFTGVSEGDNVLDIFAGGGWYSELFSMAVGSKGKVYAQNDEVIWRFAGQRMIKRTEGNRLTNVSRLDEVALKDMDIPANSLDVVFTALNYHDLFFTQTTDREGNTVKLREAPVDYRAALANIRNAMKDDGVLVIIDHAAPAGSGYEPANSTHRIDPNIVIYQLEQAGFKLVEEAFYLRNANDNYSQSVFAEGLRGATDRFVFKFKKAE
jgi:predicted methyltransferase